MAGQHRFTLKPISLAVVAALAAPASALAQSAATGDQALPEVKVSAPTDNTSFKPETSSVGGKGEPQLLRDIPQSVTVINRAVMESQGVTSLADALRNVPGITLGAAEGGTIGNNINLRGFSARTDLYIDGFRDRGQYYRDVFSLDSIEVLKGPSSMLFGRGSTGGVINQVSKLPSLTPSNQISVTAGTQPSARTTVDINKPLSDTSAFRVAIMTQEVSSTRDVMKNQDYGVAPSLRFGIGTPTEFTLTGLFLHNHDMPDYGQPPVNGQPAGVNRNNFYGLTDDRTVQDVGEFSARIKHKINNDVSVRNQIQYSRYRIDARETGPNNVGTITGGVYTPILNGNTNGNLTAVPLTSLFTQLGSHDRLINDSSLYNQTDVSMDFATGSVKHQLVVGLEVGRDLYGNQGFTRNGLPVLSVANPVYQVTPANVTTTLGNNAQSSATTVAPYFNDTISLTEQWKFVGGLRWDSYKAGITNSIPTATTTGSANQTIHYTSVRTGLIYQPTNVQSYYVSYGTSFDPSLETLTVTAGQQALPPEENRSKELGAKWDLFNGNLSLNTAVFQIDKTNARSQVSAGVYQLTGNVRVNGFEASAAGRIRPNWQVIAGYAYLDAKIVQSSPLDGTMGMTLANTPRNSASLWTTYNLTRMWEIGGGSTFMSTRYANNQNTVAVPNYVRLDATLAYHEKKYDLRLNLLNLANRFNYDALIPSDGGRSVPGIGRTALVTYTYKF